jgi:hypothetical protein
MLRDNMSPSGELNNVAVTRFVLQYRNTPDRDTGLSPAYMLLGRQLKDFLPSKPNQLPAIGSHKNLSTTWQEVAEWRELDLAKRSAKDQENLSGKFKEHAPPCDDTEPGREQSQEMGQTRCCCCCLAQ